MFSDTWWCFHEWRSSPSPAASHSTRWFESQHRHWFSIPVTLEIVSGFWLLVFILSSQSLKTHLLFSPSFSSSSIVHQRRSGAFQVKFSNCWLENGKNGKCFYYLTLFNIKKFLMYLYYTLIVTLCHIEALVWTLLFLLHLLFSIVYSSFSQTNSAVRNMNMTFDFSGISQLSAKPKCDRKVKGQQAQHP